MSTPPADILPWDSEFFGRTIARVRGERLDEAGYRRLIEWARSRDVQLVYFLAEPDDPGTLCVARTHRLKLVDIRVTLERDLGSTLGPADPDTGVAVRRAVDADVPTLSALASEIHTASRFFADPAVPRERASALYAAWIENSVRGEIADDVYVAEIGGVPSAYITGAVGSDGSGSIGLLGVGRGARGRGLGGILVHTMLARFREHGCGRVDVVTQGANIAAQRLYQRCGFLTSSVRIWYHIWLT